MKKRIFSMLTALALCLTMLPTAWATVPGTELAAADWTVTAFDDLEEDVANQTLPQLVEGGEDEGPDLPDTLGAKAYQGEDEPQPVDIAVTWAADPDFDQTTPGDYIYTPALPERYALAEGVVLPAITVTVQAASDAEDEQSEPPTEGKPVVYAAGEDDTAVNWADAADTDWYTNAEDVTTEFTISTAAQLAGLASLVNNGNNFSGKTITLGADIDLNSQSWDPISNSSSKNFQGTFDGQGHTVSGLYVSISKTSTATYAGLFGRVKGGTVKNLAVSGEVTAKLTTSSTAAAYAGGVVGYNGGNVENCSFSGNVSASVNMTNSTMNYAYAGGVVGYANSGTTVKNCYHTGTVTATATGSGATAYAGGVAGSNYATVTNCYHTGTVTASGGSDGYAGGVAGKSSGTVSNCYFLQEEGGTLNGIGYNASTSGAEPKTEDAFASGEVAYLLNGGDTQDPDSPWRQNLTGDDADGSPVLDNTHAQVVKLGGAYLNPLQPGADGIYEISTAAELAWFANEVNSGKTTISGRLMNNIDLSSVCGATIGEDGAAVSWTPIGSSSSNSFNGTFDGQGHTVSGLYVSISENYAYAYAGLFGLVNGGTVKNLAVSGEVTAEVTASTLKTANAGGVAGYNSGGNVENCSFSGNVSASLNMTNNGLSFAAAGGVVGYATSNATVKNCYHTGTVTATATGSGTTAYAGGVAGFNYSGTVTNCYHTGTGTVTASGGRDGYAGGVAGSGTVSNCYFLQEEGGTLSGIGNNASASGAESKTAAEFASGEVAWLLNGGENQDENSPWYQNLTGDDADDSPVLDSTHAQVVKLGGAYLNPLQPGTDGVYEISTAAELVWFANEVNGGNTGISGRLVDDIDLSSVCGADLGSWTPIGNGGNDSQSFQGTFDGQGHTVSGLYVSISKTGSSVYAGLFGRVYGGTVKNLAVSGEVTAEVTDQASNSPYAGGVAGYNKDGNVENCSFSGNVSASSVSISQYTITSYAGGVAGYNKDGNVENCYHTGTVTATATGSNPYNAHAGGVAGFNSGTVTNCYHTGTVTASGGQNNYAGGVVGSNAKSSTVTNCYFLQEDGSSLSGIGNNNGTAENVEGKDTAAFASGEVAHLLQAGQTAGKEQVWGQTLVGDTKDTAPVLTSDEDLSVVKVTFMVKAESGDGYTKYAEKYTNAGGTVALPEEPTSGTYAFVKWSQSADANGAEFTGETEVTEDITVYAVGQLQYGAAEGSKTVNTTYGVEKTADLSECIAYADDETSAAKNFSYTITIGNTGNYFSISGDTLTVSSSTPAGTYELTITAKENTPQIMLFSTDSFGTSDVTFTVTVVVAKATPTVTAPAANTLTYTGKAQALVTAGTTTGGTIQYSLAENGDYTDSVPTGTNAGTYTVWYKVNGDTNHTNTEPASVPVTIAPKTAELEAPTAPNTVTYGATLSETGLTSGWSWSDGSTVPTVTNSGYDATYEVTDYANYNWNDVEGYNSDTHIVTRTVTVTVTPAASSISTPPTAKTGLVYTGSQQALVDAGSGVVGGTLVYSLTADGTYSEDIPMGTDAKAYTVYYKVVGDDNHTDTVAASVTVTIAKAEPTYALPTGLTAIYGQTLADVMFDAAGWAWNDSTLSVGNVGTNTFSATFTPSDTENYNTVQADVTVTVEKAASSVSTPPTAVQNIVYDGSEHALVNADGVATGGTLVYSTDGTNYLTEIPMGTDANTYTVYYKVVGDANHTDTVPASMPVTIAKADPEYIAPTAKELTYTGEAQALVSAGTTEHGTIQYSTDGTTYSTDIPTGKDAGDYTVWYKVVGDDNHTDTVAASVTVTIAKAAPAYSAPTAKELTYTGEAQALVSAGTTEHGTIQYSTDGTTYSAEIPTGTSAGEYTVYYKVVGDGNHTDTVTASVEVIIAKATPTYIAPTDVTAVRGQTLASVKLPSGWAWVDGTQSVGSENTFEATYTPEDTDNYSTVTVDITVTIAAKVDVEPGETVEIGDTTVTNNGDGTVTVTGEDGTEITVTLPDGSDSVAVDSDGNVTVPEDTTVKVGDTEITLPSGGTVDSDGNVTGEAVRIGGTTITAPEGETVTTSPDGTTTVPSGTTVKVGDTTITIGEDTTRATVDENGNITLPSGGAVTVETEDGETVTITVPTDGGEITINEDDETGETTLTVPDGTTVTIGDTEIILPSGGTVDGDGNVTGKEVQIGDTTITAPEGETVTTSPDGTTTAPSGTTIQTGDGPEITLPSGGTVDGDGNVTGKEVQIGGTMITAPEGETVTTSPDGTTTAPSGTTVQTGDGPEITLPSGGTVDGDGNVTGEAVRIGGTTITAPEGETVTTTPDGTTTVPGGTTVEIGETTITIGENVEDATVDKDGNITLPNGGTATLETEDGETVTITVPTEGGKITVNKDEETGETTLTVPDGTTVQTGDGPEITLPNGGEVAADGSVTAGTVQVGDTTITAPEGETVTTTPDGATTAPGGSTVAVGDITITIGEDGEEATVGADGSITLPNGGTATLETEDGKTVTIEVPEGGTVSVDDDGKIVLPGGSTVTIGNHTTTIPTAGGKLNVSTGAVTFNRSGSSTYTSTVKQTDNGAGLPFTDVPESAYYYDAVVWALENDITAGISATLFGPDAPCTRAQAVTFLWRAAGSPAPKSANNPFTDVAAGDYYYDAVLWAVENGITVGTSTTTFSPDLACTRAQIVTFLWRASGSTVETASNPFADVSTGDYYYDAVLWAVKNEVTAGTSTNAFSPDLNCTRAQIVTFLYRAEED